MLGVGRNAHAVDEEVDAFLRVDESKVWVFVDHRDGIARIVGSHGGLATLHLVKDFVHDVGLHDVLLGFQRIGDGGDLINGLRIHRQTNRLGCNRVSVAGIVEHQHIVCVRNIPHVRPFRGRLLDHRRVVDQARCAPHVGHAVLVAGVEAAVQICFTDAGKVRNVVHVQLGQHALLGHLAHHVIRREDDIIGYAAGFQLGVEALVGVVGRVIDLDAGQLLECGQNVDALVRTVGDVQAVVVDIQRDMVVGKALPIVVAGDGNILVDLDVIGGQHRRGAHHGDSQCGQRCSGKLFQLHLQRPPSSSMALRMAFWLRR